jgi:Uma2 family endonuclease
VIVFVKSIPRLTRPQTGLQGSIRINGEVSIPIGIHNLQSFRDWARSDDYPQRGDFCWLDDIFWVDLSMEDAYTHGLVKTAFAAVIYGFCAAADLGDVYVDRMRVSHPEANLSCEPDVVFVAHESFESGAIREVEGAKEANIIEFEGTPDLVVEILSDSSEEKDIELLPGRLFAAGVKEYWLVDARGEQVSFDIFRRGPKGFVKMPRRSEKVRSQVFGYSFQLSRGMNRRGRPTYTLTYS